MKTWGTPARGWAMGVDLPITLGMGGYFSNDSNAFPSMLIVTDVDEN